MEVAPNSRNQWILYYEPMSKIPQELTLHLPRGHFTAEWTDVVSGKSLKKADILNGKLVVPFSGKDMIAVIKAVAGKQ